jgi:hypothetical protein
MLGTGTERLVVVVTTRESEFERRGRVIQHSHEVNQQWDEHQGRCKAV